MRKSRIGPIAERGPLERRRDCRLPVCRGMVAGLRHVAEGEHSFSVSTDGMPKGMYLINVSVSGHTAAAKMIVR